MKKEKLINYIEDKFSLELQEEWDCCGFQIDCNDNYDKVLICLDITPKIANYAIRENVDLIISHHPLIFQNYAKTDKYLRNVFHNLYANDVSVYSLHTNYDNHNYGMNYAYIDRLGYEVINSDCMIKMFNANLSLIDKILEVNKDVRIYNKKADINKVGVVLGAGGSFIEKAIACECDAFISSEFKHNEINKAKENDLMLIDVTHQSEVIFSNEIANFLSCFDDIEIIVYKDNYDVISINKEISK